jgi:hypothetical protein
VERWTLNERYYPVADPASVEKCRRCRGWTARLTCVSRVDVSHRWLHERVCALRLRTRRRRFDTTVEIVGPTSYDDGPAGSVAIARIPVGEFLDHALRVDMLVRLLHRPAGHPAYDAPQLVVTRSGPAELDGGDLGWLAAWTVACGVADRPVGTAWALGRYGFADIAEGRWIRTEPRRHRR